MILNILANIYLENYLDLIEYDFEYFANIYLVNYLDLIEYDFEYFGQSGINV